MRPFRFGPQPVPGPLRGYVASISAYASPAGPAEATPPAEHRGLPSPGLTFVLPVGQPLDVAWAGVPDSRVVQWSTVSGLHPGPAVIHQGPAQAGLYLDLTLAGARALLGLPAAALAGELVSLEDLGVPVLADLPAQLHAASDWAHRVRVVTDALERSCEPDRAGRRPAVDRALDRLTAGVAVQRVADEVGYGRRHLTDLVRRETGVSSKQLHRISRFARSRTSLLTQGACASLAHTAAETGYADQSHLSREWVLLAGCPPSVWLREELPFVQADPLGIGSE